MPTLPHARMIFADPPDNTGMQYVGFDDRCPASIYDAWLSQILTQGIYCSEIFWMSYFYRHQLSVYKALSYWTDVDIDWHPFIWRFTFGQHNNNDCGSGYRPILRVLSPTEM
jgi:hypothetical protein